MNLDAREDRGHQMTPGNSWLKGTSGTLGLSTTSAAIGLISQ